MYADPKTKICSFNISLVHHFQMVYMYNLYIIYSSHIWLCLGYIITVMFTTHIHCMHVYIMYNCMNYVCICINIIITCMVRI